MVLALIIANIIPVRVVLVAPKAAKISYNSNFGVNRVL
jgi:hypothetical protein